MHIKINFEQDAESSPCNWTEIENRVRHWLAGLVPATPAFTLNGKNSTLSLEIHPEDLITPVQELHKLLYDQPVNFTVLTEAAEH